MNGPAGVARPPTRPLLLGLYRIVPLGDNRVQVCNAGRSVVLSATASAASIASAASGASGGELASLLHALDGRTSADELHRRYPTLAAGVLNLLTARGMLVEGAPVGPAGVEVDGRDSGGDGYGGDGYGRDSGGDGSGGDGSGGAVWARSASAFQGHVSPGELRHRLARSTVAISGCGPVGAATSVLLARTGVGRILLSDSRAVLSEEVALTPAWSEDDAGMGRAEASAKACQHNRRVAIGIVAAPIPIVDLRDIDLVVAEHVPSPPSSAHNEADAWLELGIPYLLHSQDALEAVVGPLVIAGGQPCHRCRDVRRLSHIAHPGEHLAYLEHRRVAARGPDVFLGSHSAILAGLLATETVRYLTGAEGPSRGGALVVDLADLSVGREEILPVPGCPGCESFDEGSR